MLIEERIRQYLKENGITQTWLSNQTGITLSKLNASLNGKRKLYANEFAMIIKILDVDANTFINY